MFSTKYDSTTAARKRSRTHGYHFHHHSHHLRDEWCGVAPLSSSLASSSITAPARHLTLAQHANLQWPIGLQEQCTTTSLSVHLATAREMTTRFSLTTLKALGHARMLGDYQGRLVDGKCFLSVERTGTANQMEIVKAAWKDGL
ncbi:hypothetical protein BD410DRAFT_781792, partial [Rickenella mellea]